MLFSCRISSNIFIIFSLSFGFTAIDVSVLCTVPAIAAADAGGDHVDSAELVVVFSAFGLRLNKSSKRLTYNRVVKLGSEVCLA